jgi:transcriptional regulator with XRE-family HTH domain
MFAKRLKRLREDAGMQQQDMAKVLKIAKSTYHNYETGKREPDIDTLKIIAEYFNVTVDYLIGKTDHPQTVVRYDIPQELKAIGISYLVVAKRMQDADIPPEDVEKIIQYMEAQKKIKGLG